MAMRMEGKKTKVSTGDKSRLSGPGRAPMKDTRKGKAGGAKSMSGGRASNPVADFRFPGKLT